MLTSVKPFFQYNICQGATPMAMRSTWVTIGTKKEKRDAADGHKATNLTSLKFTT